MSDGALPHVVPNNFVKWMAAEGERPPRAWTSDQLMANQIPVEDLAAHNFPSSTQTPTQNAESVEQPEEISTESEEDEFLQATQPDWQILRREEWCEEDRARRVYRNRTVGMLRRYLRYSIETGRLPSLVGREFFRSNVTKYQVTTFEDRVIFVFDMEKCLARLDDFSREVLGRVVLQEYDHEEAAKLMGCTRMTVHRRLLEALDLLSFILREAGLLAVVSQNRKNSCQGGKNDDFSASDCEQAK